MKVHLSKALGGSKTICYNYKHAEIVENSDETLTSPLTVQHFSPNRTKAFYSLLFLECPSNM